MEKFEDKTQSGNEPAVKVGNFVPRDAVNLGWFSSKEVNPKNNIALVDLSSNISENVNDTQVFNKIMFANELGVLEDESGNPFVSSGEVYISDTFLSEDTFSERYILEDVVNKKYIYNYYVSKYFTLLNTKSYFDSNINSFIDQNFVPKNIKVLDQNGNLYADPETGDLKYRISFESFLTDENLNLNEIPHRIIVLISDINPGPLTLVYDKVEVDQFGIWSKQVLGYSETVNYIPIFSKVEEETEVANNSSINKKVFSIKRNTKKSKIDKEKSFQEDLFVTVPRKAIDDNRSFEVFNWRILAKINSSVDFSVVNLGKTFNTDKIVTKTVNVGVLYSSSVGRDLTKINPYVFSNLERSSFNLAKFQLINPLSVEQSKSEADYWLVDLDTITQQEIESFDVLSCSLHWKLTDSQAQKIKAFTANAGTIVIDAFNAPNDCLSYLSQSLNISPAPIVSPTVAPSYQEDSLYLSSAKNNAFNINDEIFAPDCGIAGYNKEVNNSFKRFSYFSNSDLDAIYSIGSQKVFAAIRETRQTDRLVSSNVVVSTTGFLKYCNDIYSGSSLFSTPNNQEVNLSFGQLDVFSNFVEGPYKFLYNCVSVGLNDRINSTNQIQDIRSSVHIFAGSWNNDWVIDSDVLFDDEKEKYFKNAIVGSEQSFVRQIIPIPKKRYLQELQKLTSIVDSIFYEQNDENITLYIEFTNQNVEWTNAEAVSTEEKLELSSTYNLVKIVNKDTSCDVYTNKKSAPFVIPSGFGPHIIKDKLIPSKKNKLTVHPTSYPRSYPINMQVANFATAGNDIPKKFNAEVNITANVNFIQKNTFTWNQEEVIQEAVPGFYGPGEQGTLIEFPITSFQSSQSILSNVSDPYNAFAYTYDIDEGNTWDEYFAGKGSGTYVRYIQLTLTAAGFNTSIDGIFGTQTSAQVKAFQANRGIRRDGIVDSETKSYLAKVWQSMPANTRSSYITRINNNQYKDRSIDKYINAAMKSADVASGLLGSGFRLINFSGTARSADSIRVWVSFTLPSDDNIDYVESITFFGESFGTKVQASSYKGFRIVDVNIGDAPIYKIGAAYHSTNFSRSNNSRKITFAKDGRDRKGKVVSVLLEGSQLGGAFGLNASGLAISGLSVQCQTKRGESFIEGKPKITTNIPRSFSTERTVSGVVFATIPVEDISFTENIVNLDARLISQYGKLTSITLYALGEQDFTSSTIDYSNLNEPLNSISFKPRADRGETVDILNFQDASVTNVTANIKPSSVKESGTNISYADSSVQLMLSGREIKLTSNISSYNSATTFSSRRNITSYNLTNPQKTYIRPNKNVLNYFDGVSLFCDSEGKPFGIELAATSQSLRQDIDVYYSDISVINTVPKQPGLQYGFFDTINKQFIGKTITYSKYQQLGPSNVYIGAYAFDYDGDLNTQKEFTGAYNGDTFEPVNVPVKIAYPIYSVQSKPRNKIQVLGMPENLTKTEPWPIFITSGSFSKTFDLGLLRPKGWLAKYNNQKLTARYDTSSLDTAKWSKIFGTGYYDIYSEKPIINTTRSIRTRRYPIHSVHERSNDLVRFAAPFNEIIKIYTRQSQSAEWQLVDRSLIRDINCSTGVIQFISPIVPSDENLIKVDYTVKYEGISVGQANGIPFPTNPFLNRNNVKINKPLYIYLKPKEIYKNENLFTTTDSPEIIGKSKVEEYEVDSLINFTYNNNIFNPSDSAEYDPFALPIAIIYVINTFSDENFTLNDLRVKGGGALASIDINTLTRSINQTINYWDVYPSLGEAYPKGGYVIIKIPSIVKKNFINPQEVYDIIRDNITAGVIFELQDMEGKDWGGNVEISS